MDAILFFMIVVPAGLYLCLSLEQFILTYAVMILIGLGACLLSYLSTKNDKYKQDKYWKYIRFLDDLLGIIESIFVGTVMYAVFIILVKIVANHMIAPEFQSAIDTILNGF